MLGPALIAGIHVFVWPIRVPAVFLNMVSATMSQTSDPLLGESGKKLSLESYDQYITLYSSM